jgi:hypothetical protein
LQDDIEQSQKRDIPQIID